MLQRSAPSNPHWKRSRTVERVQTAATVVVFTGLIWWTANQSVSESRRFSVRLRMTAAPGVVVDTEANLTFSVVLRGPKRQLDQFESALRTGGETLDYRVTTLPTESIETLDESAREVLMRTSGLRGAGLAIDDVEPARVVYRLEPLSEHAITLEAEFGSMAISNAAVVPRTVQATMTARRFNDMKGRIVLRMERRLQEWLNANQEQSEFSLTVSVPPEGAASVKPDKVVVTGRVVGQIGTRQLGPIQILPAIPLALQGKYLVAPIAEDGFRTDVLVRGPNERLAALQVDQIRAFVEVKTADEGLAGQPIVRRAVVVTPPALGLVGDAPEVSFRLEPIPSPSTGNP